MNFLKVLVGLGCFVLIANAVNHVARGEIEIYEVDPAGAVRTWIFKPLVDRQQVVYQIPESVGAVFRMDNCVVFDARNWDCTIPSGPAGVAMIQGELVDKPPGFTQEASGLTWLRIRVIGM